MSEDQKIPDEKPRDRSGGLKTPKDDASASQAAPENNAVPPPPQTSNLKSETTNIETHAHHLHKTPGHGWKHYFFEFLMLFLAVTLGFLAENQREHYVERQREKQFAQLLLADLKKDAQWMDEVIGIKRWRCPKNRQSVLFYFPPRRANECKTDLLLQSLS